MAEFQFKGLSTESLAKNLVSEADAEDGQPGFDQVANGVNGVAERGRVARTVGRKIPAGYASGRRRPNSSPEEPAL